MMENNNPIGETIVITPAIHSYFCYLPDRENFPVGAEAIIAFMRGYKSRENFFYLEREDPNDPLNPFQSGGVPEILIREAINPYKVTCENDGE